MHLLFDIVNYTTTFQQCIYNILTMPQLVVIFGRKSHSSEHELSLNKGQVSENVHIYN
jgi:hypothetical protein